MHAPNPLRSLFDVFGRLTDSHVGEVNGRAFEQLVRLLDVEPGSRGRCILLRAPRAGFGKTHLLTHAVRHFGGSHEFVLLSLADGSRIHAGTVLEDVLRRLCRPLPAAGGLTELDLLARRVLALGLEPLVRSGDVPCQDRESALAALRDRATETFDFHHPNAVTAHWARENFGVLGPRLGFELSQRIGAPLREVAGWVEALYRFAAATPDQPARIGALIEAAGGGASLDRLGALLQLLSPLRRVVLVTDEMEGLSSDPQAALHLAAFVTSLRQTAESVDVIIALNRDLWDSAFRPRLSGGLEDRLAEWVIELEPLPLCEAEALIESRAPGRGRAIAAKLDLEPEDLYPRAILRRAAELLESAEVAAAAEVTSAASVVPVAPATPAVASPFGVIAPAEEPAPEPPAAPAAAVAEEPPAAPVEVAVTPEPPAAPAEVAPPPPTAPGFAAATPEPPAAPVEVAPPPPAAPAVSWDIPAERAASIPSVFEPESPVAAAREPEPFEPEPFIPQAAAAASTPPAPETPASAAAETPAPAESALEAWRRRWLPAEPEPASQPFAAAPEPAPEPRMEPEPFRPDEPAPAAPAAPAEVQPEPRRWDFTPEPPAQPPVAAPPAPASAEPAFQPHSVPSPFRRFAEETPAQPSEPTPATAPSEPATPAAATAPTTPPAEPASTSPDLPPSQPAQPAPTSQPAPEQPHEADRVDELLRQFRERYGRR